MDPRTFYVIPYMLIGILTFILGQHTHFRRDTGHSWNLAALCFSAAWWSFLEGTLYMGLDMETNLLLTKLQYMGITMTPPLMLNFVNSNFMGRYKISPMVQALVFLPAAMFLGLAFAYPYTQLLWENASVTTDLGFPFLVLERGPAFWLLVGYSYTLLTLATYTLIQASMLGEYLMRKQAQLSLAGILCVWISNALYVSKTFPVAHIDPSPLSFAIVVCCFSIALHRYGLLQIIPTAHNTAFQHLNEAILVLDAQHHLVEVNHGARELFDIPPEMLSGYPVQRVLPELPELTADLDTGHQTRPISITIDGKPRAFEMTLTPLAGQGSLRLGTMITLRDADVTTAMDGLNYYLLALNSQFYLMDANKKLLDTLGKTKSEIHGWHIEDILRGTKLEAALHGLREYRRNGEETIGEYTHAGRIYTYRYNSLDRGNGKTQGIFACIRDSTAEGLQKRQLGHANKMEAIGRLTAEMAHEIRTPLSVLRNYLFGLKRIDSLKKDEGIHSALTDMEIAVQKMATMVDRLLSHSRLPTTETEVINVRAELDKIVSLHDKGIREKYTRVSIACKQSLQLEITPSTFEAIIANLFRNAMDAVPPHGAIELAVHANDDVVVLECKDSGPGIPAENQEYIFEPFFTTKPRNKGTGLGLYITYNEIRGCGGTIDVQSSPETGTRFTVRLPAKQNNTPGQRE